MPTPPPPPRDLRPAAITSRSVTLVWDDIPDVTGWQVCIDGVWHDTGSATPSFTVSGLAPNHTYPFRVRAVLEWTPE